MKRLSDTGKSDEDHHDRLYFGGLPSVRDLKFLYEGGTDAILYIGSVGDGVKHGLMPIPNREAAKATCAEVGLLFGEISYTDGFTTENIDGIIDFLDFALKHTGQSDPNNAAVANGPVYVVAEDPRVAIEALQLFRANRGLIPSPTPVTIAQQDMNNHGFEMSDTTLAKICSTLGETTCEKLSLPTDVVVTAEQGLQYHWLKYLFQIGKVGVFDAGQIQKFHVKALQDANIKSVINMRIAEPINMINVAKAVGIATTGAADWVAANAGLVIDSDRPTSYVCQYPDDITTTEYKDCTENGFNFETKNPLEWGDDNALNPADEGVDLEAAGISYFHIPVSSMAKPDSIPFDAETFKMYGDQFIAAINKAEELGGNVLFHCTIGYRTGAFPTALLGALVEGGATVEYPSRVYTPDAAAPQLSYDQMANMMHGWGYDVKDQVTGHRFELGSDLLFSTLDTLKFDGSVDWATGRVTGKIITRPACSATTYATEAEAIACSTDNAAHAMGDKWMPGATHKKDSEKDSAIVLSANLICAALALVVAMLA